MDDFKLMYCILKVLLACEDKVKWNESLLAPEVLRVSLRKRDRTLFRMQADGLITGIEKECWIGDDISDDDRVSFAGQPSVTVKGLEFLESNGLMKKAKAELKDTAVSIASQTLANILARP